MKEITEGNKLIAEFMGYVFGERWRNPNHLKVVYRPENKSKNASDWDWGSKDRTHDDYINEFIKYHSSWDWLMPVVEKIENGLKWKYNVAIINNLYWPNGKMYEVVINDAGNSLFLEMPPIEDKIKSVWFAVIEFIKWYNKSK